MAKTVSQNVWSKSPDRRDKTIQNKKAEYDAYVASTYANIVSSVPGDTMSYRYREFLKKILVHITQTDVENQRFLTNVDFNKKEDISLILPYYIKRIKEIAFYFRSKRSEVSNIKHQHSLDGSTEGFKRFIKRFILSLVADQSFISKHKRNAVPTFDTVVDNTMIDVQPLYDITSNYHDKIEDAIAGIIFLDEDFKASIKKLHSKYPIYVTDKKTGKYLYTSNNRKIKVKVTRTNYRDLPVRHFLNGEVDINKLETVYEKQYIENFTGTEHWYLSGNSDTYNFKKLFDPKAPHSNIANQRHPTLAFSDSTKTLKSINEIGGNFLPSKFGISTLHTQGIRIKLNTANLSAGKIVTFPNPKIYGDINYTGKITWTEDNTWFKADRSNNFIAGDIYDMQGVQKMYPYQTREETLRLNVQGLSRAEDKVDFWIGDNKTIWANSDIYPKKPMSPYNIDGKQDDLLITDKTVYEWYGDSYGNEFALYKETQPSKQTSSQKKGIYTITPTFSDPKYTPNYDLDLDLFQKPLIKLYKHQYNIGNTTYTTSVNNLTEEVSMLSKDNLYGEIYFRNAYSSVIGPLNDMIDTLFIKYIDDVDIIDELKTKVVDFSVYGNTIVIRTENYLVVEKYVLDSGTGVLKAAPTPKIFFSVNKAVSQYEQIGRPWYYEEKNELFVVKTTLHPHLSGTNYKLVFPEITILNLDNLHRTKAFPGADILKDDIYNKPFKTYTELAKKNLTLLDTGLSINLVRYGNPQISFNRGTKTYAITYTGFDDIGMTYINSFWLRKRESTFFIVRSALLHPEKNVFSSNFTDFKDVSGQFVSDIKTHNFITHRMHTDASTRYNALGIDTAKFESKPTEYNRLSHSYVPQNGSVVFGTHAYYREANSSRWIETSQTKPNDIAGGMGRTTYFVPTSTVQGGEKITVLADVGFYSYNNWQTPWGASLFFFDASSTSYDGLEFVDSPTNTDWNNTHKQYTTTGDLGIHTFLSAYGINQCHPTKTPLVFGVGLDLHNNRIFATGNQSQTISPLTYLSASSAESGIPTLNTVISSRSDIKFTTIKAELEIVSNRLKVSMKPYGGTTFYEYISLDISKYMNSFPTQLGVGMCIMGTHDIANYETILPGSSSRRTTCELKNFSVFGGKPTPDSTMSMTTL